MTKTLVPRLNWVYKRPYFIGMKRKKYKKTVHHTPSYMPKMIINDDYLPLSALYSSFWTCFDDNAGYSLLTESDPSLDFEKILGREVQYAKEDFYSKRVILSVTVEKVFTIQLTNCSEINTHHNFVSLLPVETAPSTQKLPHPLAETIDHCLQHESDLGLPKTNEKLTSDQKELLQWHIRLGHIPFKHLLILGIHPKAPLKSQNYDLMFLLHSRACS